MCIHRVQYADRRKSPLSAVVNLHLPGGVVKRLSASAVVSPCSQFRRGRAKRGIFGGFRSAT